MSNFVSFGTPEMVPHTKNLGNGRIQGFDVDWVWGTRFENPEILGFAIIESILTQITN